MSLNKPQLGQNLAPKESMGKLVLGIDPSLNSTGWALLLNKSNSFSLVECGTIGNKLPASDCMEKIKLIGCKLQETIQRHGVKEVAMEKTICNANPGSSLKLGMVRGAIAFVAASNGCSISEYEPKKIKSALTGTGSASKESVAFMVKQILGGKASENLSQHDITDAIATAIAHCNISTSILHKYSK